MAHFETSYALVKEFEGSYSNDKNDSGGETYSGIARNFFPKWAGWSIIDQYKKTLGNNPSTLSRTLTEIPRLQKLVQDWYRTEWWDRLGLESLEQSLADEIFEQSVNLGKSGCGKKVQTICNAYNYKNGQAIFPDLTVDGAIGPKTLRALQLIISSGKAAAASLVHALNCMQGSHYLELAAKKPSQRVFTVGWMKRTY